MDLNEKTYKTRDDSDRKEGLPSVELIQKATAMV